MLDKYARLTPSSTPERLLLEQTGKLSSVRSPKGTELIRKKTRVGSHDPLFQFFKILALIENYTVE